MEEELGERFGEENGRKKKKKAHQMFIESRLKKKSMRIHFDPESILDKMYAKLLRQRDCKNPVADTRQAIVFLHTQFRKLVLCRVGDGMVIHHMFSSCISLVYHPLEGCFCLNQQVWLTRIMSVAQVQERGERKIREQSTFCVQVLNKSLHTLLPLSSHEPQGHTKLQRRWG